MELSKADYKAFSKKDKPVVDVLKTDITLSSIAPQSINASNIQNAFKSFICVWDTGAQITSVSYNTIKSLELIDKHIDEIEVIGVNSRSTAKVYLISQFILPNNIIFFNTQVTCCDIGGDCDVLIGMDIITQGDFAITHHGNETLFTFRTPPHNKKIDFVVRKNV